MIPGEIERLIYQCIMGKNVVIIASDDGAASERFKELRNAVVVAADDFRLFVEKAEREIIYGHITERETIGLFAAQAAISAMGVGFQEAAEKMHESFIGTFADYEPSGIIAALFNPIENSRQSIAPLVKQRVINNNYRKLHALPLIRRSRCRWRPRESRRSFDGLSPGVIIDEYAFAEERRCKH